MKRLLLSALLLLSFFDANAQRRGSIVRIDGSISVACINDYMDCCHHHQIEDNWCWAACIQMVLDYYDISATQSMIVQRTYGDLYDITANKEDIIDAVDGWNICDQTLEARYEQYKNPQTLIDAVARGKPLIIGLDEDDVSIGHAYVLTHIFFTKDYNNNMTPTRVVVLNPANSEDLEESLDWSDFYERINTIITITSY